MVNVVKKINKIIHLYLEQSSPQSIKPVILDYQDSKVMLNFVLLYDYEK